MTLVSIGRRLLDAARAFSKPCPPHLAAAPALADENWVSHAGPVVYEEESGENAVFLDCDSVIAHRTGIRTIAGNYDHRSHLTGY